MGAAISALHAAHGIELRTSSVVTSVTGDDGHHTLHLADGTTHQTPYVVVGIGVAPNVDWLIGSGVKLDDGILTDASGQTNIPECGRRRPSHDTSTPWSTSRCGSSTGPTPWRRAATWGSTSPEARPSRSAAFPLDRPSTAGASSATAGPAPGRRTGRGSLPRTSSWSYGRHGSFHAAFASGHARSLRGYRKLLARGATWDEALEMAQVANPDLAAPRP